MEMVPYCFDGTGDVWYHALEDFPPLCLSRSTSPLVMSVQDHLPIAAAPSGHLNSKNNLQGSDHGSSSALILREEDNYHPPMFAEPAPPAAGDPYYFDQLAPIPADGATAGLDNALMLLPFSDIDLDAFGDHKAPLDDHMMIVPPTAAAADPRPTGENAGAVDGRDGDHRKPMVIAADHYHRPPGATNGLAEMAAMAVRNGEQKHHQASSVAAALPPPAPRPRGRRSVGEWSAAAAAGNSKTRLDHIGLEELRKYFYMPITKAAREMNVGLTVLKKRCRELGVARWPHRKMKSLKSLILNVQEMGKGMSPAAVQQELAELETYCALMEENPSIELTDRTKKLRQACFKESYKRRRAANVNLIDHIYNFGHHDHQQQLPMQGTSSDDGHSQGSGFFGY